MVTFVLLRSCQPGPGKVFEILAQDVARNQFRHYQDIHITGHWALYALDLG